jgi:hypothetical protein
LLGDALVEAVSPASANTGKVGRTWTMCPATATAVPGYRPAPEGGSAPVRTPARRPVALALSQRRPSGARMPQSFAHHARSLPDLSAPGLDRAPELLRPLGRDPVRRVV